LLYYDLLFDSCRLRHRQDIVVGQRRPGPFEKTGLICLGASVRTRSWAGDRAGVVKAVACRAGEVKPFLVGRPSLTELAGAIDARVEPVLIPWDCADGFFEAYWHRPEAYLDEQVRRGMSVWARVGLRLLVS
jgi:hypothetical protein